MRKLLINISVLGIVALVFSSCSTEPTVPVTDSEVTAPSKDSSEPPPPLPPPSLDEFDNTYSLHDRNVFSITDLKDEKKTVSVNMYTPRIKADGMNCEDETCTTFFEFKDEVYPSFSHTQALGGAVDNAGDLDNDGVCELYFVPDWFTSNWTGLNVYSLKNNKWKKIAHGSIRRSDIGETDSLYLSYEKRIIKHNEKYFELLENVMDENGDEKLVPKKFYFNK